MNKDLLRQLCHLFGGMITIVLAFLFYEHRLFRLMDFYIFMGCLLVVVAFIDRVVNKFRPLSPVFFLVEAVIFYYASRTAMDTEDAIVTKMIQIAALAYIVLAVYFVTGKVLGKYKKQFHIKRSRRRRKRSMATTANPVNL